MQPWRRIIPPLRDARIKIGNCSDDLFSMRIAAIPDITTSEEHIWASIQRTIEELADNLDDLLEAVGDAAQRSDQEAPCQQ